MAHEEVPAGRIRLLRAVDPERDHLRGVRTDDAVEVVGYEDFLCPYCRRLWRVYRRLRATMGDRLVYVYRQFPNERAHPGAELVARASEAAALQGKFWEMHDRIFDHALPIGAPEVREIARAIGLDLERFERDLQSDEVRDRVLEDLRDGRANGVTGTPTLFIDEFRYDGAWDYFSLLEAFEQPVAARVQRSARVFASLPTSTGLVLLLMVVLGLICANSPLAPLYSRVFDAEFVIGPSWAPLSLNVREWLSEGLLTVFFLLVGLEIRREMTKGALSQWRAAILPVVAAVGGVLMPALLYLSLNRGPTASGWSIPTATDIALALALLAVLGDRVPIGLRVFVAALAIVDDILSVLTLAIFYPRAFAPAFVFLVIGLLLVLAAFNRWRVYALWPYLFVSLALWVSLHALGIHAALTGVLLAMFIPTRPSPAPAPLLAQAATALAALEHAEVVAKREGRDEQELETEPVWEWTTRNLSAASERLVSPAEQIERTVAPWSAYVILPLFAFSATGVRLAADFSSQDARRIFAGVVLGLVLGKPLGILLASALATWTRLAVAPEGVTRRQLLGAACLCGVGDLLALLIADRALVPAESAVAKLAVLLGSLIAGTLGFLVLRYQSAPMTPSPK